MNQSATNTGFNTKTHQEYEELIAPLFELPELPPADMATEQFAKVDAFYNAEHARENKTLDDLVSGKSTRDLGLIAVEHNVKEQKTAPVDGKATTLEESISMIRETGTGRQERLVMLGDPRVSACFWRKMEKDGNVRVQSGQMVLDVSMKMAVRTYKEAAAEVGVDVAGFARFEAARSGWNRIIPGVKNHEILVFGAGTQDELGKLGEDVKLFADRLVANGIVAESDIIHRPGQEVVTFKSNKELQRLLSQADNSVILQRAAEQAARDASRTRTATETKDGKTSDSATAAPAEKKVGNPKEPAIDKDSIFELYQLFAQPLVPTQIRGGGEWNLGKLSRAYELYMQLGLQRLQQADVPKHVAKIIAGGLEGIAESCRRTVAMGTTSKHGLPHESQLVKDFAAVVDFRATAGIELTPEYKWLSLEQNEIRNRLGASRPVDELPRAPVDISHYSTRSGERVPARDGKRESNGSVTPAVTAKLKQHENGGMER